MIKHEKIQGIPSFEEYNISEKQSDYCLLIPIINEGDRIKNELQRAKNHNINSLVDIIICDGGSTDNSTDIDLLESLGVNTLLVKTSSGKQGAQLRMGIYTALNRKYKGILTIDGNNKDSIESVPLFIEKLEQGYDLVQGSRYVKGGKGINTPKSRHFAVKFIHAPIISLTAKQRFTDTTSAFRAYSYKYLNHEKTKPLRDIFAGYELLAYLSVRFKALGLKACEVPVTRRYPDTGKTPTKISPIKGNLQLLKVLFTNLFGGYNPK